MSDGPSVEDDCEEITLVEIDDTAGTVPRCLRCGCVLKVGGDAATPTFVEMAENAPMTCWRSMSGAWQWCPVMVPATLTITG